jgi:hypothetical protein
VKPHAFHPAAAEEYAEAAFYYSRISPELGGRFYDEMEELIRDIRGDPERYRLFDTPVRRHFPTCFLMPSGMSIKSTECGLSP